MRKPITPKFFVELCLNCPFVIWKLKIKFFMIVSPKSLQKLTNVKIFHKKKAKSMPHSVCRSIQRNFFPEFSYFDDQFKKWWRVQKPSYLNNPLLQQQASHQLNIVFKIKRKKTAINDNKFNGVKLNGVKNREMSDYLPSSVRIN